MFSFLQKISSKKPTDKKPERKSTLRRKDSTVSVPSIDFAYNSGYNTTQRESSVGLDTTTSSSYRYTKNSTNITDDLDTDTDTIKSKSKFSYRKSNLSLASLGSGYFTTGRYNKHKNNKITKSTENINNGDNY